MARDVRRATSSGCLKIERCDRITDVGLGREKRPQPIRCKVSVKSTVANNSSAHDLRELICGTAFKPSHPDGSMAPALISLLQGEPNSALLLGPGIEHGLRKIGDREI